MPPASDLTLQRQIPVDSPDSQMFLCWFALASWTARLGNLTLQRQIPVDSLDGQMFLHWFALASWTARLGNLTLQRQIPVDSLDDQMFLHWFALSTFYHNCRTNKRVFCQNFSHIVAPLKKFHPHTPVYAGSTAAIGRGPSDLALNLLTAHPPEEGASNAASSLSAFCAFQCPFHSRLTARRNISSSSFLVNAEGDTRTVPHSSVPIF